MFIIFQDVKISYDYLLLEISEDPYSIHYSFLINETLNFIFSFYQLTIELILLHFNQNYSSFFISFTFISLCFFMNFLHDYYLLAILKNQCLLYNLVISYEYFTHLLRESRSNIV